jgi:integration host factor subunit beta
MNPGSGQNLLTGANRLNKNGLIQALKQKTGLSKHEAREVVEIFFDSMIDAFVKGERVEIRGFCSFFIKEYDGYTGRNPKTGEKVQIPAKRLPFFKCGKDLKERVDY